MAIALDKIITSPSAPLGAVDRRDRQEFRVPHLISTGYLSLESRETAPVVAIALEAWIYISREPEVKIV